MAVRIDLNISLDGFAATADQTPQDPFGQDWGRLTKAYVSTQTFRERVLHDTSGQGSTGLDDRYAKEYFTQVGAEIMGAGMFGLHANEGDPHWRGWWGDEPPFECPVFVLTHRLPRPTIQMPNGTSFHFLTASPHEVLELAIDAAQGQDIRVGGGATVARDFLAAGLVDRLHVAVVPIVLSKGIRLWDNLRHFEENYEVRTEVAESGVIHITFER